MPDRRDPVPPPGFLALQTLTLLRHAKSGYVDGLTDFNRHLTESGRRDVLTTALWLQSRHCIPTALLVSSAVRTRETAQILRETLNLDSAAIRHLPELYLASPEVLVREINQTEDSAHLMVIGHNPGLEALSTLLDAHAPERMPTCSVNHFTLAPRPGSAEGSDSDTHTTTEEPPGEASLFETPTNGLIRHRIRLRNELQAHLAFHQAPQS